MAGCGGGGSGSVNMVPSGGDGSGGATGPSVFTNLSATNAGYAATAASSAADARPSAGSVTQSSNTINNVTQDRVSVTAEHGASRNSYSVRNGSSWSINTSNDIHLNYGVPPWNGQELVKRVNGGTLYVDVYSDIEAPQRTTTTGTPQTVTANDQVSHSGNVSFGEILRGDGRGSLNGVLGTFSCSSCDWDIDGTYDPATNTSDGTVNSISGVTFTPDSGTTTSAPDTDYLAGGVWLFIPDGAASADDVVFGAFGDGADPFRQSNLVALQGTARYTGDATGIYSVSSTTTEDEIGYWDADATLEANFGGASELGTIDGSITGIDLDGEREAGSLTLQEASIGSSDSGFFEGRLSGAVGEFDYTGRWGGQFFGNSETDGKPGSVGGTLGGTHDGGTSGNISFVGVFGAHKQP